MEIEWLKLRVLAFFISIGLNRSKKAFIAVFGKKPASEALAETIDIICKKVGIDSGEYLIRKSFVNDLTP